MQRKVFVIAVALIALVGGAVFAATSQKVSAAATGATGTAATTSLAGGFFRGHGGVDDEALATALGVTVDELNAAYQKASAAALKQAVEQGLITQAQADELTANGETFPLGRGGEGWLSQKGIDFDALLANALGISVEKLQQAYQTAFYAQIDQAVTDGNLTQEQADLAKGQYALQTNSGFQSAMKSAFEAAVAQAVTDGVITQAQADQILANQTGMGYRLMGPGGMHGMGGIEGGHGRGGRGHGEFGGGHILPETQTETVTP